MTVSTRYTEIDHKMFGMSDQWVGGTQTNVVRYYSNLYGIERIFGTGHNWPPSGKRHRLYPHEDLGDSMILQRRTIINEPQKLSLRYFYAPGYGWTYNGNIYADVYSKTYAPSDLPQPITQALMVGMGTKGWAKYKPTASNGGLSVAIGELRELNDLVPAAARQIPQIIRRGLPTLQQLRDIMSRADFFRGAGKAYLLANFGWIPFVNDVRTFITNVQRADKLVAQLIRDNGKAVRRGGPVDLVVDHASSQSRSYFTLPTLVTYLYGPLQTRYIDENWLQRFWFSGRFRYYIPTDNSPEHVAQRKAQLNRIVYGLELSPKMLWNLMPWSWLLDWFASTDSIFSNLMVDDQDGLVADYAYIMGHKTYSKRITVTGSFVNGVGFSTSQTYLEEVKERERALPYGFGLTWTGFSNRQLATLAALGITRGRGW